jgi:Na+/H+ ion antiporter subunit
VRHVVAWVVWWIALFWLWLLLVGEWNREQVVAAALAATIAGAGAEFARKRTGFEAPVPLRILAAVPQALGMVVVDFGIVSWALFASVVRRRVVRGEFIERVSPVAHGTGPRAWAVLVSSYSPNAYVVELDPETRRVLLHDLVPHRKSESPV